MNDILSEEAKSFKIIRPKVKNGQYKPYVARLKKPDNTAVLNLSTDPNEIFTALYNLFGSNGPQRFFMRYYFPRRYIYTSNLIIEPKKMAMIDPKEKVELVNKYIKNFRGIPRNKIVDRRNCIFDFTDILKIAVPTDKQMMIKPKVIEYVTKIWPEIICYTMFDNSSHDKTNDIEEESEESYDLSNEDYKEFPLKNPFEDLSEEDWNILSNMVDQSASTEAFKEFLFAKTKLFALSGPAFGISKFGFDKFIISVPFGLVKHNLFDMQHLTGRIDYLRVHKLDPDLIYPLSIIRFIFSCYNALATGNSSNMDFVNELIKHNVTFHIYSKNGTGFCINLKELKNDMHYNPLRFGQQLINRLKLLCMINAGVVSEADLDKLEIDVTNADFDKVTAAASDNTYDIKEKLKDDMRPVIDTDVAISALIEAKSSTEEGEYDTIIETDDAKNAIIDDKDEKDTRSHYVMTPDNITESKKALNSLFAVMSNIKAGANKKTTIKSSDDSPDIEFDERELEDILDDSSETEDNSDEVEAEEIEETEENDVLTEIQAENEESDNDSEEFDDKYDEHNNDENILADENTEKDYEKAAKQKGPKTVKSVDKYEVNKGTRDTKRINLIKEKYKSLEINGEKIEKIIGNAAKVDIDREVKLGTKKPRTSDEGVTKMNLTTFQQAYVKNNYQADIINAVRSLSVNKDVPLYMTSVDVKDTSDQFTDKLTYSFVLEDEFKKKHNLKFDVPKLDENGFLKMSGNKAYLKKQLIRKPIVKIGPDKVYITTQLNSYQVMRTGMVLNKGSEVVRRLLSQFFIDNPNVKIERGNCTESNRDYLTTLEYDALAKDYFAITLNPDSKYGEHIVIYFSQTTIRDKIKQFNVKTGFKDDVIPDNYLPFAINYTTNTLYSIDMNKNSSINSSIVQIFNQHSNADGLMDFVKKIKAPKRRIMTKVEIQSFKVPMIVFLNYTFGWERVKSYFPENEIEFSEKRLDKTNKLSIKFYDGYLYYNQYPVAGAILLNGLAEIDTENYRYEDLNNQALYINHTYDKYHTRNIVKGWITLRESMLDFKTLQILEAMNLPTDLLEIFLYCNDLLVDNQCLPESDISNYRIRGNEIISQCLYGVLNDQYNVYKKRSGKRVMMTIPPNAVMTKVYKTEILEFYNNINPIAEIQNNGLCTFKGPGGTKLEQAFTTRKRSYDPSYFGIFGISTPDNSNAGIVKYLTLNPNITNTLGFVGKTDHKDYSLNDIAPAAEALTPFVTKVDDPSRIAFVSGQNNHVGGLLESSLPCVRTGVEKTIQFQCSDNFAMKVNKECIVNEINEDLKKIFVTYKDGTKDCIDYNDRLLKNSDAFNNATYTCHVRPGMKLKPGDTVAADSRFFKVDPFTHELIYTQTKNALVAILEGSYTEDDSSCITQEFANQIHMDFTTRKQICIGAMDTIIDYKKPGDYVNLGDPIFVFDDSGTFEEEQDDSEDDIIKMLYGEIDGDTMAEMIHQTPKAPTSGTIKEMRVYWSCPVEKMSKTAAKFVNAYISKIKKEILAEEKFTGKVSEKRKLIQPIDKNNYTSGEPRINGVIIDPNGSILIEYFISNENGMGVGDKIALNSSLKSVVGTVIETGLEPYTESGLKLDGLFSWISVNARMIVSIWYQFIGTILYKKSKKIATDFLIEIGEKVPKNKRRKEF